VLLSRRFSSEELLLFAVDAKALGYRGVILQAETALAKADVAISQKRKPIHAGDFVIDVDKHRVWVRGEEAQLTPQEFALLTYFTQHPRQLLSHETLLEAFWGDPTAPIEPLRVLIQTLRAKVDAHVPPRYIVTQHRLGYRFNPSPYPIP
jgi:DNA-binding response OmpR family regulator